MLIIANSVALFVIRRELFNTSLFNVCKYLYPLFNPDAAGTLCVFKQIADQIIELELLKYFVVSRCLVDLMIKI